MADLIDMYARYVENTFITEIVSEVTPTINAVANTQYLCGEVESLTIVLPQSGIVDVIFESGDTPTVLTLPAGVKMHPSWPGVKANTKYEINFCDGVGVYSYWTN